MQREMMHEIKSKRIIGNKTLICIDKYEVHHISFDFLGLSSPN